MDSWNTILELAQTEDCPFINAWLDVVAEVGAQNEVAELTLKFMKERDFQFIRALDNAMTEFDM